MLDEINFSFLLGLGLMSWLLLCYFDILKGHMESENQLNQETVQPYIVINNDKCPKCPNELKIYLNSVCGCIMFYIFMKCFLFTRRCIKNARKVARLQSTTQHSNGTQYDLNNSQRINSMMTLNEIPTDAALNDQLNILTIEDEEAPLEINNEYFDTISISTTESIVEQSVNLNNNEDNMQPYVLNSDNLVRENTQVEPLLLPDIESDGEIIEDVKLEFDDYTVYNNIDDDDNEIDEFGYKVSKCLFEECKGDDEDYVEMNEDDEDYIEVNDIDKADAESVKSDANYVQVNEVDEVDLEINEADRDDPEADEADNDDTLVNDVYENEIEVSEVEDSDSDDSEFIEDEPKVDMATYISTLLTASNKSRTVTLDESWDYEQMYMPPASSSTVLSTVARDLLPIPRYSEAQRIFSIMNLYNGYINRLCNAVDGDSE